MESSELFGCNQCSKSFDTLSRYNQHLKTHTKPFKCEECVKGFALRSDLTRHVQARHRLGVARYPCVVASCSFRASRKDNVRQHVQKSHPQLLVGPTKAKPGRQRAKPRRSLTSVLHGTPLVDQSDMFTASTCTLMQAASTGNLGFVQFILQSGVDISIQADDGSTALHCAAKADQTDMISLLIESGAQSDVVNYKGRTALHEAILGHCTSAFNVLVQRRVDITEHVLCATIQTNQTQLFKTAWESCGEQMLGMFSHELFATAANSTNTAYMDTILLIPDITQQWIRSKGSLVVLRMIHKNQKAMLECLLDSGKLDVNTTLRTSGYHESSLLYLAAAKGKSEIVGLLLEFETIDLDPEVTHEIQSPLGTAAWKGHVQVVEKLLQCSGIVLDGKRLFSRETKAYLHLACRRGHVGVIRLMLKAFDDRGLDVDVQVTSDSGLRMTPLQNAVRGGHTEAVALLLLRQDVNVNRVFGSSRMSLWQAAAQGGHAKTLSVLLGDGRVGRDDMRNSRQSLLSEAISGGNWCLVEILLEYEKVPLEITRQTLNVATEPCGKRVDILERGLLDLGRVLPPQADNVWHKAAHTGNLSLAMLLLEHAQAYDNPTHPMVDVNRKGSLGRAPLHVATEYGKIGIIELLLHHKQIDVNLIARGMTYGRAKPAIVIVEQNPRGYWSYHTEERAYTLDLLLAHGARTASRDQADNVNKLVPSASNMDMERKARDLADHSGNTRRENHAPWASVVGIGDVGGGSGVTSPAEIHTVGERIVADMRDSMAEDPDAIFEELMRYDDEDMSDNNSIEMLEREMFGESPDRFTSFWEEHVT